MSVKGPQTVPFFNFFPFFPNASIVTKSLTHHHCDKQILFCFLSPLLQDFKPDQRTAPSSTPSPSLPKIHNIPTPPHAAQSPPTTCKKNNVSQIQFSFLTNLAASIVTASLKQVTSLACSSDSSSDVSSIQALSSSGRSRAASPLS